MMTTRVPPQPSGEDEEAFWFKWAHVLLSRVFVNTPTVRFEVNANSIRAHARPPNGGGAPATDWFLGEWVSDADYAAQKVVVRTTLGTFVSVQSVPAGIPPETGSPYWAAFVWPAPGVWA